MKANNPETAATAAIMLNEVNQSTIDYRAAYMSQKSQESIIRTAGDKTLSAATDGVSGDCHPLLLRGGDRQGLTSPRGCAGVAPPLFNFL